MTANARRHARLYNIIIIITSSPRRRPTTYIFAAAAAAAADLVYNISRLFFSPSGVIIHYEKRFDVFLYSILAPQKEKKKRIIFVRAERK